jgi:hypothetical protein
MSIELDHRPVLEVPAPDPPDPWTAAEARTRRFANDLARTLLLVFVSIGAIIGVIVLLGHLAGASPAGSCGGG